MAESAQSQAGPSFDALEAAGHKRESFYAALDAKAARLEVRGHLALQAAQAFPRVDGVGVEPPIRRDWDVQEVHVRCLFIHVNHGGNDVLLPHEAGEEVAALLEESPLFLWWQTSEER